MLVFPFLLNLITCDLQNIHKCLDISCLNAHNSTFIDFWRKPSSPLRPWNLWTRHSIVLLCHSDCKYILGDHIEDITSQLSQRRSWLGSLTSLGRHSPPVHHIPLPPHRHVLLGIVGEGPYSLLYQQKLVHPFYVLLMSLGVLVLHDWETISRSWVAHYVVGLVLGVVGVSLFLSYFVLKPIPNSYVFVAGKVTLGTFVGHYVWSLMTSPLFLGTYWRYILAYLSFVASGVSAYLYYRGPIQSQRLIDIFGFAIRACGLYLIYSGTNSSLGSVLLILVGALVLALFRVFPENPPTQEIPYNLEGSVLVSREEHRCEIVQSTKAGLSELREYCRSLPPAECWKIMGSMSDPGKMASFVMGEDDISLQRIKHDPLLDTL